MIDIIDQPASGPQGEDVLDRVDEVLLLEGHLGLGNLLFELPVDPETSNAAQAILLGVEELVVEELLGLGQLGRVAWTQALIDTDQGVLMVLGEIIAKTVENQRVLNIGYDADGAGLAADLTLLLIVEERFGDCLGDLFTGVNDNRAG